MQSVKIALLGLGTVGCGVIEVLRRNGDEISRRAGQRIEVVQAAARDLSKKRPIDLTGITLVDDPFAATSSDAVDIVVELIGGVDSARDLAMAAINAGKHLVTANKALIALHGNEIFECARSRNTMVTFEAAVAGGIPIIKAIREGLSGNQIQWLAGIINGTCNFILSEMEHKGSSFEDALATAQMLGYAEADPGFDIDGIDTAHKLTILASVAFGIPLQFDKVYVEGITGLDRQDIVYAAEFGYRVKHLGIAQRISNGIELRAHPALVAESGLLANVDGVMNAVAVSGDAVGSTLYCGLGAGAQPTASAVVADLVDVVRMMTADPENHVPHLAFQHESLSDTHIAVIDEVVSAYYLRLMVKDKPGVLAKITQILADFDVSIEAVSQKEPYAAGLPVAVVLLTHRIVEKNMRQAINLIERLPEVLGKAVCMRTEVLC